MAEFLDKLDPENYIVGIVHLPTGRNATSMLRPTEQVLHMLQIFFSKLDNSDTESKKQNKDQHARQRLPSICCEEDEQLELVSGGDKHLLPFVGRSSQGGGYCLRMLNTHRMELRLTNKYVQVAPIYYNIVYSVHRYCSESKAN